MVLYPLAHSIWKLYVLLKQEWGYIVNESQGAYPHIGYTMGPKMIDQATLTRISEYLFVKSESRLYTIDSYGLHIMKLIGCKNDNWLV